VVHSSLHDTPQIGVLYFFFTHANRRQTAEDVLRVLLKQLLIQLRTIPTSLEGEYRKYEKDPTSSIRRNKYAQLFLDCAGEFVRLYSSRVFLLLDAYDEFNHDENERKERADLLSHMESFCSQGNIRLFITSRKQYRQELDDKFDAKVVEIEVDASDVDMYVTNRMEHELIAHGMKDAIKTAILKGYQGW
jgi:hypothetical protein